MFSTRDAHLPSGEGPYPTNLAIMSTGQRHIVIIDSASAHRDRATKLPCSAGLHFARRAFISPDDTRVAYTRLEFSTLPVLCVLSCALLLVSRM